MKDTRSAPTGPPGGGARAGNPLTGSGALSYQQLQDAGPPSIKRLDNPAHEEVGAAKDSDLALMFKMKARRLCPRPRPRRAAPRPQDPRQPAAPRAAHAALLRAAATHTRAWPVAACGCVCARTRVHTHARTRARAYTVRARAQVKLESKLPIDVDEYVKGFSVQLVDLTFEWCHGKRFVDLMMMTKQYEGSIIRMLHRLEELLRQLITSARAIGDAELEDKCTRGAALLRRDIVFAASLYLDDTTGPAKGAGAPPVAAAPNGPSSAEGAARAEGAQTVLTTIKPQEPANGGP